MLHLSNILNEFDLLKFNNSKNQLEATEEMRIHSN